MTIKVGVIGIGMIGQYHINRLNNILSGAKVVAVADVDMERTQAYAAEIGATAFATGEELIADASVDAVIVASWGPTHEQYVLASIAAEKPVFCEKPLAHTQEACLRILDAEVKLGRRLVQVGFMRRFDPSYRAMKAAIDNGSIGEPLMFHSGHRNPAVPGYYTSDNAISDTSVHDIDTARWLLKDEVVSVQVNKPKRSSRGENGLFDPLFIVMQTESGCLIDIETSVNIDYGYDIRGEIVGETGTIELAERNAVVVKAAGKFNGHVCEDWRERFDDAFSEEFRAWIKAIETNTPVGPSAWDGYAAQAVSDAGLKSLESGNREAVELIEKPALYRD